MSKADQFWQYAKEAMLAPYSKTDQDTQGLLEPAGTWTQAGLQERQSFNQHIRLPRSVARKGASAGSLAPSLARFIKSAAISSDRTSRYLDHFTAGLQTRAWSLSAERLNQIAKNQTG